MPDVLASLAARGFPIHPVRRVALLGHSFTVQAYASGTSDAPRGLAYWAGYLSRQRLQFDFGRVFGLAGDTSGSYDGSRPGFTSRLQAAIASRPDVLIVSDPTNDFAVGIPHDDTVANMSAIFNAVRQAGITVATWMPTPRGAPNALTASGLLLQARYANWLRLNARALGVLVADASLALADANAAGFDYATGMAVADDLHLAIPGGRALGAALAQTLGAHQFDLLSYSGADVYDAAANPFGNLLANAPMRGVGGVTSAGGSTISGQVADNWQVGIVNGAGLTIACSLVIVGGRRMQQIDISGTPTAGNPNIWLRQTPAYSAQLAAGDNLQALGYGELDAGSTGVYGFGIEQWTTDAGGSHAMRTGNSVGSATNGMFPADALAGVHRTMSNPTGASPSGFYAQYGVQGVSGQAMTAKVRLSNLEIRKVG